MIDWQLRQPPENFVGTQIGEMSIVRLAKSKDTNSRAYIYIALCLCGREERVTKSVLRQGKKRCSKCQLKKGRKKFFAELQKFIKTLDTDYGNKNGRNR